MRPLRFCMLTTFYPPWSFGGDAVQVQRLAGALVEAGHEVTVLHSREAYRTLSRDRPPDEPGHPGVRVVAIGGGAGPTSPTATHLLGRPVLTRRRLRRALGAGHDVVHFHNPSLLGGPAALQLGSGLKLYTAHEHWLVCPTHALWKYQRRVCEKPTCWRCQAVYRRPPQLWRQGDLLERSLESLDALIVLSRTSAGLHARLASHVRIERLGHFVPHPPPDDAPPPGGRPYFLFAGRLEPIKGVETLVDAFRRRRSENLLIAGDGSLEGPLRRSAADLPHVRFLGRVPQAELDGLYRHALAVLTPTLGHESFGLVPVEGFARGTPAIVHRLGALHELVEDSGGGIAYATRDELDAALASVAEDPELRRRLCERARAAYLERWTPEAHLARYLELIARLARARGNEELAAAAASAAAAHGPREQGAPAGP